MLEERIAAMNKRTEEAMAANAVQFDKRTYTVDEILILPPMRTLWKTFFFTRLYALVLLMPRIS